MIDFASCEHLSLEKRPSKAADESLRKTEPLCKVFPACTFSFSQESEPVAVRGLISRLPQKQFSWELNHHQLVRAGEGDLRSLRQLDRLARQMNYLSVSPEECPEKMSCWEKPGCLDRISVSMTSMDQMLRFSLNSLLIPSSNIASRNNHQMAPCSVDLFIPAVFSEKLIRSNPAVICSWH